MSHELFYTSAPKGLRPGSRGFCTVASTEGLPAHLAEQIESLSAYRPLFPPLDARAKLNPIVYSHLRITGRSKTYHVLSRIGPAGARLQPAQQQVCSSRHPGAGRIAGGWPRLVA